MKKGGIKIFSDYQKWRDISQKRIFTKENSK